VCRVHVQCCLYLSRYDAHLCLCFTESRCRSISCVFCFVMIVYCALKTLQLMGKPISSLLTLLTACVTCICLSASDRMSTFLLPYTYRVHLRVSAKLLLI